MSKYGFGTKEEILAQLAAFKLMEVWEAENPLRFTPQESFSLTDGLYALLPPDARASRDDPHMNGARHMMAALARLR